MAYNWPNYVPQHTDDGSGFVAGHDEWNETENTFHTDYSNTSHAFLAPNDGISFSFPPTVSDGLTPNYVPINNYGPTANYDPALNYGPTANYDSANISYDTVTNDGVAKTYGTYDCSGTLDNSAVANSATTLGISSSGPTQSTIPPAAMGSASFTPWAAIETKLPARCQPRVPLKRPLVISLACPLQGHRMSFARLKLVRDTGEEFTNRRTQQQWEGKTVEFHVPIEEAKPGQSKTMIRQDNNSVIAYAVIPGITFEDQGGDRAIRVNISQYLETHSGFDTCHELEMCTNPIRLSERYPESRIDGRLIYTRLFEWGSIFRLTDGDVGQTCLLMARLNRDVRFPMLADDDRRRKRAPNHDASLDQGPSAPKRHRAGGPPSGR